MADKNFNDLQFDELIESMRSEEAQPGVFETARDRVWKHLATQSPELPATLATGVAESICDNFREQFPLYQ